MDYMGHVFTDSGLKPDISKIAAIDKMPAPTDVQGVQRILGTVNYLAKFVPNMSEITAPLRALIHQDVEFVWDTHHTECFDKIKKLLREAPVLKYFDCRKPTVLQCDSSQSGLGCCLMQEGHPVAYASRALTPTEQNYAQIEKETLAILFGLEKFHTYVYGREIKVETDHKPLISIFSKAMHNAPRRLQRMMLRMQHYNFQLVFKPGSEVIVADALSRAYPVSCNADQSQIFNEELAMLSDTVRDLQNNESLQYIVASESLKQKLEHASQNDYIIKALSQYIVTGWPDSAADLPAELRDFYNFRDELVIENGVLFKGLRMYVPLSLRDDVMARIHSSHIGVQGCLRRAREAVFYPGMTRDILKLVSVCPVCAHVTTEQCKEPMIAQDIPDRPWQKIACDLFEYNSVDYLITVDYFSNYFEVDRLVDKRSPEIIRRLKSHFARWGLPEVLMSDNGPPFNSGAFKEFLNNYEIRHVTSSPRYPQSNGKAENAVKTVKNLMRKAAVAHTDVYLALLDWRNTPSEGFEGLSPAQRLTGRRARTLFPVHKKLLDTTTADVQRQYLKKQKNGQKQYYDRTAHEKPSIPVKHTVRAHLNDDRGWVKAEVVEQLPYRSYTVQTEDGTKYRRNRRHVRFSDEPSIVQSDTDTDADTDAAQPQQNANITQPPVPPSESSSSNAKKTQAFSRPSILRSGRTSRPPIKLNDYVVY